MIKEKHHVTFYILLVLAIICICIGEWGLAGQSTLMEYASPFSVSQQRENDRSGSFPLLSALTSVREEIAGAAFSAFTLKRDAQVQASSGRSASCSIYSIAEGWFDLYHRSLSYGRLLGEGEMQSGKKAAVINTSLAYALWGDTHAVGNTLLLGQESFTVVGIVNHSRESGQLNDCEVYIPLQTALAMELDADVQVLCGKGAGQSSFELLTQSLLPGGTFYQLHKERMRAGLPLRYLCTFFLLLVLSRLLPVINFLSHRSLEQWQKKNACVYGAKMILPTIRLALQWLAGYGAWIAIAYVTLTLAVAPAYVFSEWIPEDPSKLSSYIRLFSQPASLQTTVTENVLFIRYYGRFISAGSILMLLATTVKNYAKHLHSENQSS